MNSSVHHTLTYNASGLPRPEPSTYDLLPAVLQEKFDTFEDRYANAHAAVDGAQAQLASTQDDLDRAKSARDSLGLDTDERQKQAAQEKFDRARKRLDQRHVDVQQAIGRRETVRTVALACTRKVEGARTYEPMPQRAGDLQHVAERGKLAGLDLRIVETKVPKGASLSAVSAEIDALRAHRVGVANAVPSRESVERRLLADLAEAARRGEISVDIGNDGFGDGDARQPSISWPTVGLRAQARLAGERVMTIDVEALAARHFGDAIRAEIRAGLDQRYEGVGLALDPHEKAKKLREIDARLLELERIEAALVWQAIRNGDTSVFFRADADPRAVLGVA